LIVELERTLLPEEVQNIQKEFDRQGYPTAIQHLYNKTLLVTNQEMAWNSSPQKFQILLRFLEVKEMSIEWFGN
jgi:hypothetical protein